MRIAQLEYEILDCPDGEECLAKLERICRIAYKSEDKITVGSGLCELCGSHATSYKKHRLSRRSCNEAYWRQLDPPSSHRIIKHILSQDPPHESVLEHESITVRFVANRGFTHELVRHRIAAYTQESTRYCSYAKGKFGNQITVIKPLGLDPDMDPEWTIAMKSSEECYMDLINQGAPAQLARGVLPIDLKAEIVTTANLRQWRHIFRLRCSKKAHPDMQALMIPLRDELRKRIPIIFDEV